MIVVLARSDAGAAERLAARLEAEGRRYDRIDGRPGVVRFALEEGDPESLSRLPEVERADRVEGPWHHVGRAFRPADTVVELGGLRVGGGASVVFAGPCSVEGRGQILEIAGTVVAAGAHGLRGGVYKPRTSPYSFQGLGLPGLDLLVEARARTGLPIITEVMAPEDVEVVAEHADVLQIGTRNMQNFRLLEAVGRSQKPVLLKRGMMATIDELLAAAEYVWLRGNESIILCERGIRTFEPRLRNTLDLGAVALLKRLTHLPILVDPSHGTGLSELVPDLSRAAMALGADGLLVEVHPAPASALSDGRQSLLPEDFGALMADLRLLGEALGRPLAALPGRQARASTS